MFKIINRLKNKKGFTLIELIVVLAVLGIIALIAVPRFMTVQQEAKEDADIAVLDSIAKAAELYSIQNNDDQSIILSDLTSNGYIDTPTWQSTTDASPTVKITVSSDGSVKAEIVADSLSSR